MIASILLRYIRAAAALLLLAGLSLSPAAAQAEEPPYQALIDRYRQVIPQQMKAQHIPGFAIALVDDTRVLWAEGFGVTEYGGSPVTADTPFSIQSMSKSFTAAAVMLAVQDGLVDLDTPISTYLPDFHFKSIFEERPEDKITLRHLLSHTAGFTHDSPVGNNDDLEPGTWSEHIRRITDTWLLFPVGQHYSYANNDIDLAAYIVEQRAGMPFQQYVKTRLLDPLGMQHSSFDMETIRAMPGRALGHTAFFRNLPIIPIMPAGGMYSSANDMARYLLFYLNLGKAGDQQVLQPDLIKRMYEAQFPASGYNGYALGLGVFRDGNGTIKISHGGGGFGFLSMMTWYPQMKYGVVWLSNSTEHNLQEKFADQILADFYQVASDTLRQRASGAPSFPQKSFGSQDPVNLSDASLVTLIANRSLKPGPDTLKRWQGYAGVYGTSSWGRIIQNCAFELRGKTPASAGPYFCGQVFFEVQPGLFFGGGGDTLGEALDLRGPVPIWKNLRQVKISPALILFYQVFLGACALFFLAALIIPPLAALVRRLRRGRGKLPGRLPGEPSAGSRQPDKPRLPGALLRAAAILAGLAMLLGLLLIAALTQYPFLVLGGVPLPRPNMATPEQILLLLPYIGLGLTLVAAALSAIAWRRGLRPRPAQMAGLAVLLAFTVAVLV